MPLSGWRSCEDKIKKHYFGGNALVINKKFLLISCVAWKESSLYSRYTPLLPSPPDPPLTPSVSFFVQPVKVQAVIPSDATRSMIINFFM